MSTIYVDSAASGANNGTSWTDAFTSLGSTTGANAGDTILVDDGHDQALSAATTWTWSNGTTANPVVILSVDKATDALSAGAVVRHTNSNNLALQGSIRVHGLTFGIYGDMILGSSSSASMTFESCAFQVASGATGNRRLQITSSANGGSVYRFRGGSIDLDTGGASNGFVQIQSAGKVELVGVSVRANSAASQIFMLQARPIALRLVGCDLSASTETTLVNWNGAPGATAEFAGCRLPSGYTPATGTIALGNRLTLERSVAGSISVPPLGLIYEASEAGTIQSTLSRYRTGGADDGVNANAHSWELAAGSSAKEAITPLASPPLMRWVAGGSSVTLTVYVASGTTLNDDDFWIELTGPDDSSPAYAEAHVVSTRMNPQGTPSALTTDGTSTWNGTGVGTKQKVSVTYTPTLAGPVAVRAYLAKPSTTCYLDPYLDVA